MLEQLFINHIAVIEKASIDLRGGLTVLTGETGAGKSIIIDAIHAVLGERTSKELVRSGAKTASVSALFSSISDSVVAHLKDFSIPLEEDGSLLIQREIRAEGKSLCKLNGMPATVSMLKAIGTELVSIHGQHESYELLSPDVHMTYLDRFGGLEMLLSTYQESYSTLRSLQQQMEALRTDEGEKARRVDLLRYQIEEIEKANVRPGEQEELTVQRDAIRNREKIVSVIASLNILLHGDEENDGLLSKLEGAVADTEKAASYLAELPEIGQKFQDAHYALEDADGLLRQIGFEFDPNMLDTIEERLEVLYRLGLKYGETEEKILDFLERSKEELYEIEFSSEKYDALEQAYEKEKERAIELAKSLSKERKNFSERFSCLVKEELAFLNMPGIEFQLEIQRVPLYSMGCDKIQFLVAPNKGESLKPMSKIASGGELSRIMLAIKTVLSGKDRIDTLVFDEVDAGISGSAAGKVGQKLKQVSKDRQVLCITHLAQIAALADSHFYIHKHVEDGRTYTDVQLLDFEGRKQELARIIGGDALTSLQLDMAEEMLTNA